MVSLFGSRFITARGFLCPSQLTREQILDCQSRKLRCLLDHAYRNVPYYRSLFDRHGVAPHRIQSAADLPMVPITTKSDLRQAPLEETLARGISPGRLLATTTSGYSGEPFTVRCTWFEKRLENLLWVRALRHIGVRMKDRCGSIMYVRPSDQRERTSPERLVKALGFYRSVTFDCCQPSENILRALRRYRPDFVVGYPGVLALVGENMTSQDRRAIRPHGLAAVGEVLTEAARERISTAFGAPVYNLYGSHELGTVAWECEETRELHVCDDHVLLEVLNDGRPAAPGQSGQLVATNLDAFAMPFVRYRLGDVVTKGSEVCPCGQPFSTLRRVEGRRIDYFPLPDGRLLHPFQIVGTALATAEWILRYQLIQERRDRILLRVVPSRRPAGEEIRRLEDAVRSFLGPRVGFSVIPVPRIDTGPGGKLRALCSLVDSTAGTTRA